MPSRRKKKNRLVKVSALAIAAATRLPIAGAMAQSVKIACSQPFQIGNLIACGSGSYVVAPDGGHSVKGCLIINTTAQAASCTVQTFGGPITQNLVLSMGAPTFKMTAGTAQVTVKNLRIMERGGTVSAKTLTLTSGQIANKMTFDIGGTVVYTDQQAVGSYTGNVIISATLN